MCSHRKAAAPRYRRLRRPCSNLFGNLLKNFGVCLNELSNYNFKVDCWLFAARQNWYCTDNVLFLLLLPLKEMLFREGRKGFIHVVLHFASSEDVGDLYLVLPSRKVSLWN